MRKENLTFPILISFNELAWIVVFALILLYSIEIGQPKIDMKKAKEDSVQAEKDLDKAKQELAQAEKDLNKAKEERDQALSQLEGIDKEPLLKQQLIGLKGKLNRVAIIVDQSGSMAKGGQWEHARSIIRTWLEHLPIEQAVLITFHGTATAYPTDGTFLDMSGSNKVQNKDKLLRQFDRIKPSGNTNTLNALRKAYQYRDLDTIILFTDGFPDRGSEIFDIEMAEKIYALCRQHGQQIPINTVGLGSYFSKQLSEFLHRLPKETGGSFIGR